MKINKKLNYRPVQLKNSQLNLGFKSELIIKIGFTRIEDTKFSIVIILLEKIKMNFGGSVMGK